MVSFMFFIKETFLYCPPSCKRIVEYDVEELLASDLSTINHPIDIAPVIRELKESSNGKPRLSFAVQLITSLTMKEWMMYSNNSNFYSGDFGRTNYKSHLNQEKLDTTRSTSWQYELQYINRIMIRIRIYLN
ncbi:hypothetical protein RhiirC2_852189 [Rhizophagus irregularis]|uniref:Uncharacterized protein n=1 Tax=Rhizophagus irregularis TaxID=588596 RepID=A0A2N1N0J5_9GLOM|nr:hypothetical protein RhiirC2_852189 [Rhizophagus irregularis]